MPYTAQEMLDRVLYRDEEVLVLDKPAGLPVHFGTRTVEELGQYLHHLTFGRAELPRLAHRLDKDTSGCLVLARDLPTATRLGHLFTAGLVAKAYWAVVLGRPAGDAGTIDLPLLKVHIPGCSKVMVDPAGKPALTDWRLLGSAGGLSWLELNPRTGRMHQLRAHLAFSGIPILGDPIYGPEQPPSARLHLLARSVGIPAGPPPTPPLTATARPPPHMEPTLRALGWPGDA